MCVRERERDRETETETETDRQIDKKTDSNRDRETEICKQTGFFLNENGGGLGVKNNNTSFLLTPRKWKFTTHLYGPARLTFNRQCEQ